MTEIVLILAYDRSLGKYRFIHENVAYDQHTEVMVYYRTSLKRYRAIDSYLFEDLQQSSQLPMFDNVEEARTWAEENNIKKIDENSITSYTPEEEKKEALISVKLSLDYDDEIIL